MATLPCSESIGPTGVSHSSIGGGVLSGGGGAMNTGIRVFFSAFPDVCSTTFCGSFGIPVGLVVMDGGLKGRGGFYRLVLVIHHLSYQLHLVSPQSLVVKVLVVFLSFSFLQYYHRSLPLRGSLARFVQLLE